MIKRIAFVTTYWDYSRQRMLASYERMFPRGTEIFLFCKKNNAKKFKTNKTKKIEYSSKKFLLFLELRRLCKKNKIDILTNLSGGATMGVTLGITNLFSRVKTIFYDHGNPKKKGLVLLSIFQLLFDRVLVCSEDFIHKVERYLFLIRRRINYLLIPLDTNKFKIKSKSQQRDRFNLSAKEKIIIFVGRIEYLKGSDFLLKSIYANPDKTFILVGALDDESIKDNLPNINNVIWKNSLTQEDLVGLYNASDLCLFLSRTEGQPFVPREAMACGVPCIVSEIESVRLLKPAIKVPFDEALIQKAIVNFFNLSIKERRDLGKMSREYILDKFSEKNLIKDHINFLLTP